MAKPTVAIIGLDVIGGSLGLALRQAEAELTTVGYDADLRLARQALQHGLVESIESSPGAAMRGAALVVISGPLSAVQGALRAARGLEPGSILTDTARLKVPVLRWAEESLPAGVQFVGGHPIVPGVPGGIEAARPNLFQGRTYCLTPSPRTDPDALDSVTQLIRSLGAQPYFLDPVEHDSQAAALEQLSPLLAAALYRAASRSPSWRDMVRLASDAFRHATQVSAAEPGEYDDLALANAENLARWVEVYIEGLHEVRGLLKGQDRKLLNELFSDAISRRWDRPGQLDQVPAAREEATGPQNGAQPGSSLSRVLHRRRGPSPHRGSSL